MRVRAYGKIGKEGERERGKTEREEERLRIPSARLINEVIDVTPLWVLGSA